MHLELLQRAKLMAVVTDEALLRAHHRFLRDDAEDARLSSEGGDAAHGIKLARAFDARLHKEFALVDASRAPALGLRWRTEAEVVGGKGQFFCGALGCSGTEGLVVYELPFAYSEAGGGAEKMALVKATLCGSCARRAFGAAVAAATAAEAKR